MKSHVSLKNNDQFDVRIKCLPQNFIIKRNKEEEAFKMHNHLENNHCLGNKKALLHHLQLYYQLTGRPADSAFPQTYHIANGEKD